MKHELIVPKSDRVHRLVARETLRFCSSKEYTESEFDFPVVLGKDKKGELIIVDLPLLGNTVIYGPTGGPSFYEGVFACQKFFGFAERIWTKNTFRVRPSSPAYTEHFERYSERGLGKAGLQFILCGETSAAASYLKKYADLFDTAIEIATAYHIIAIGFTGSSALGVARKILLPADTFIRPTFRANSLFEKRLTTSIVSLFCIKYSRRGQKGAREKTVFQKVGRVRGLHL